MAHEPKQPKTIRDCKLKRVHPRLPLRVHSAVPKGFAGTAWVTRSARNPLPETPSAAPNGVPIAFASGSEMS